jgi:hypothetical protein
VPDEQEIRKARAAAEHTARVAAEADEAVARTEGKVAKARDDLGAVRDSLAVAQQEAKAKHRAADEAAVALAELEPTADVSVAAGVAAATGKQG